MVLEVISIINSILSMYALNISNPFKSSYIFSWKVSGLLKTSICSFWYLHFLHVSKILQRYLDPGDNSIQKYPMFKSDDDACVKSLALSEYLVFLGP